MFARVHLRAYGSLVSFAFAWVHSGAPSGRRVHSGSYGFTRARIWVTVFIGVHVGSLGCA